MSAISIMRKLLTDHAPLTAVVPAARILAGDVPQGTELPAIGIQEVSLNEIPTVARASASTTQVSRVQVTVHAPDLATQKKLIKLTALGPGVHRFDYLTYRVKSVMPAGVGPDLNNLEDDGVYQQSRDFMVTFAEAS